MVTRINDTKAIRNVKKTYREAEHRITIIAMRANKPHQSRE